MACVGFPETNIASLTPEKKDAAMTRLAAFLLGLCLLSTPIAAQAEGCTVIYRGATSNAVAQWDSFPCPPLPPDVAATQCYSYQPAFYAAGQWYAVPGASPVTTSSYAPARSAARVMPASARTSFRSGTATNLRGYRVRVVIQ